MPTTDPAAAVTSPPAAGTANGTAPPSKASPVYQWPYIGPGCAPTAVGVHPTAAHPHLPTDGEEGPGVDRQKEREERQARREVLKEFRKPVAGLPTDLLFEIPGRCAGGRRRSPRALRAGALFCRGGARAAASHRRPPPAARPLLQAYCGVPDQGL